MALVLLRDDIRTAVCCIEFEFAEEACSLVGLSSFCYLLLSSNDQTRSSSQTQAVKSFPDTGGQCC